VRGPQVVARVAAAGAPATGIRARAGRVDARPMHQAPSGPEGRAGPEWSQVDQGQGQQQLTSRQPADSSIQVGGVAIRAWSWRNRHGDPRPALSSSIMDSGMAIGRWAIGAATAQQQPADQAGRLCCRAQLDAATWANGLGGTGSIRAAEALWIHTLSKTADTGAKQGDKEWPGQGDRQGGRQLLEVMSRRKPRGRPPDWRIRSRGHELFVGEQATGTSNTTRPLADCGCAGRMPIGRYPPGNCSKLVEINHGAALAQHHHTLLI